MAFDRSFSVSRFSRRLVPFLLVLPLAFGAGCGGDEQPQQQGQAHPAGQQQPAHGGAGASGNQRPGGGRPDAQAVPVAVGEAFIGPIASYYHSTATLEAEKQAQVLARVTGVVSALSAEEGLEVETGAPLLTIGNDEYRYRLQQAEASTANLRARYQRLEQMRAEELATVEEFQAAKSDLATAEAAEGLARLELSYTTVRAPFTGSVTQRLVDVGQNISPGDALFVLADFHPLLARVHVPSREFHQLKAEQTVDLVLDSDGSRLTGRIKLISPVIDATSGTIKITVQVDEYPAGTRPGDFAEVRIVTENRPAAVLVPRSAVLTDKGEQIVYLAANGESSGDGPVPATAERRVVEIGFTDDDHAQILDGLTAGDLIVVKGQRSLKHGSPLKILEGAGRKDAS